LPARRPWSHLTSQVTIYGWSTSPGDQEMMARSPHDEN
jgi:hypothetical protein